ncbi:MAG: ABC transporter permease, partial [Planctomycetota bacterium]|nr:ABC transporter permease [Planctomycetota bacterium]
MTRLVLYLGSVLMIVVRSLRQHALSSVVTIGSVGLAAGLVMSVFSVAQQSRDAFAGGPVGFDAVLGARGSQLQLVLNTIFHLETSPGNVPWSVYEEIAADERVELALPFAVGDNYKGFRIVGTDERIFTEVTFGEGAAARSLTFEPNGRPFDGARREAVVGSFVAERTGLELGSHFFPSHGVRGVVEDEHHDEESGGAHDDHAHDDEYVVAGVLEPSGTPNDRVIWIPLEGLYRMDGHYLRGDGETLYEAAPG